MPPVFAHGAMRLYLLHLLEDGPKHGYEIIKALTDRFGGTYSPSAGSVYPRLAKLEEEGLVSTRREGRRNLYDLTAEGRDELGERHLELQGIDADIAESVTRLADTLSSEIRDNMRSLRADLAATAERHRTSGTGSASRPTSPGPPSPPPGRDPGSPSPEFGRARPAGSRRTGRPSGSRRSLHELEHQLDDFRMQLRADLRAAAGRDGVDEATHATVRLLLEQAKSSIRDVLR
ncbi:PadR family transcriptional regulator [Arthrobacter sp. JSM 101049]|uniref:PadR family transcriptional regulator n=1 Tax=Arthrobacter sp. JSM 101049 TaxID=929097 RepID=UPI0035615689